LVQKRQLMRGERERERERGSRIGKVGKEIER